MATMFQPVNSDFEDDILDSTLWLWFYFNCSSSNLVAGSAQRCCCPIAYCLLYLLIILIQTPCFSAYVTEMLAEKLVLSLLLDSLLTKQIQIRILIQTYRCMVRYMVRYSTSWITVRNTIFFAFWHNFLPFVSSLLINFFHLFEHVFS